MHHVATHNPPLLVTAVSHTHGFSKEQLAFVCAHFAGHTTFFIGQVNLPESLGTVECGLHGPVMGDEPVLEAEVTYGTRGERTNLSRLVERKTRPTRVVTVIAGPVEGETEIVIYTVFGGPLSPREVSDRALPDAQRQDSVKFWAEHALSKDSA